MGHISHIFRDSNLAYVMIDMGVVDKFWWGGESVLISAVESYLENQGHDADQIKKALWVQTIQMIPIREGEHGNNALKRTPNGNAIKHHYVLVKVKLQKETQLLSIAKIWAQTIFKAAHEVSNNTNSMQEVLKAIKENKSLFKNDGSIGGLYGYMVNTFAHNEDAAVIEMKSEMHREFTKEIEFEEDRFHLNQFLPDYYIQQLAKDCWDAKKWKEVPSEALIFFKNNWKTGARKACRGVIGRIRE